MILSDMSALLTEYDTPRYLNFSDVDLRVAVNRHLPDDSQMWPEDPILCFQRRLFLRFLSRYFTSSEEMAQLKLYVGAYLVWYLSPFTSQYLTKQMMLDVGRPRSTMSYVRFRCTEKITSLLPLVVFRVAMDRLPEVDKADVFNVYRKIRDATITMFRKQDQNVADELDKEFQSISLNAYNFTLSWDTVEQAFGFLPRLQGNFFQIYLKAARAITASLKKSMRKPGNDMFHAPGVSLSPLYRLLVGREIRVDLATILPPMFRHDFPLAVKMAGIGVLIAESLLRLMFILYYMVGVFVGQWVLMLLRAFKRNDSSLWIVDCNLTYLFRKILKTPGNIR